MNESTKPNFCGSCGTAISSSSAFCQGCGISLTPNDSTIKNFSDESIRNSLKNYERKYNVSCLECGYIGLAGITRWKKKKLRNILLVIFGIFFLLLGVLVPGLGYIGGLFLLVGCIEILFGKVKIWVMCPNCSLELGPIKCNFGLPDKIA